MKSALIGHTSEATAYLVADYPYGRTVRTQIRYWIEHKPGKGFRFVSQTMNPKTARWNKPKADVYARLAMAMYLDESGHVRHFPVTEYSGPEAIARFVSQFPECVSGELRAFVRMSERFEGLRATGKAEFVVTVNGVERPRSDAERTREREDGAARFEAWKTISHKLHVAS